jgi:hypothetical protein
VAFGRASIRAATNQRQEETNENVPPLDRCIRPSSAPSSARRRQTALRSSILSGSCCQPSDPGRPGPGRGEQLPNNSASSDRVFKTITEKVVAFHDSYKNNAYVQVSGFTVHLAVLPSGHDDSRMSGHDATKMCGHNHQNAQVPRIVQHTPRGRAWKVLEPDPEAEARAAALLSRMIRPRSP